MVWAQTPRLKSANISRKNKLQFSKHLCILCVCMSSSKNTRGQWHENCSERGKQLANFQSRLEHRLSAQQTWRINRHLTTVPWQLHIDLPSTPRPFEPSWWVNRIPRSGLFDSCNPWGFYHSICFFEIYKSTSHGCCWYSRFKWRPFHCFVPLAISRGARAQTAFRTLFKGSVRNARHKTSRRRKNAPTQGWWRDKLWVDVEGRKLGWKSWLSIINHNLHHSCKKLHYFGI